jgi:hypothetical protein
LSEDFIGRITESKDMVSRSLEKMMLIAIGLSTAVIVGVPVLMYAIDTINTTSQLQEVQLASETIHNATMVVDSGMTNATTITVWLNPGVTVTSVGNTLTVLFSEDGGFPRTWSQTYIHEISIDTPVLNHNTKVPYTMDVSLIDDVIHISFYEVPI